MNGKWGLFEGDPLNIPFSSTVLGYFRDLEYIFVCKIGGASEILPVIL